MGGRGGSYSKNSFLGRKGKQIDIQTAVNNTNPHYFDGEEWQRNCQRCVFAYEMQRRGYDVEAKPRILDGSDTLPYGDAPGGWKQVLKGMEQVNMPSRNTIAKMDEQMAKWGDGARAIVRVKWKGNKGGHVFVAEQVNGKTHYVDPQTRFSVNIKDYMNVAIKGKTELLRMDKATPTPLLEKAVQRRRK